MCDACNNTAAGRLQVDAALEKKVEMKDVVRREFARSIGAEQVECAPTPPSALSCTHEPCVCVVCAAAKATKTALSRVDHTQPRVSRGGNSLVPRGGPVMQHLMGRRVAVQGGERRVR